MGQLNLNMIYKSNFNFYYYDFILRGVNIEYNNNLSPCRNGMYMAFNSFWCGNGYIL